MTWISVSRPGKQQVNILCSMIIAGAKLKFHSYMLCRGVIVDFHSANISYKWPEIFKLNMFWLVKLALYLHSA